MSLNKWKWIIIINQVVIPITLPQCFTCGLVTGTNERRSDPQRFSLLRLCYGNRRSTSISPGRDRSTLPILPQHNVNSPALCVISTLAHGGLDHFSIPQGSTRVWYIADTVLIGLRDPKMASILEYNCVWGGGGKGTE